MALNAAALLSENGYGGDFTMESLKEIDRLIDEHSRDGVAIAHGLLDPEELPQSNRTDIRLVSLGCYVGETIRRFYGGEWHSASDEMTPHALLHLQVIFDTGAQVHPVSKVFKRFRSGPEDNVYNFAQMLTLFAS